MTMTDALAELHRETMEKLLKDMPLEKRLEGLSAEDRLAGLSPEEVLAALPRKSRETLIERLKSMQ